MSLSLIKVRYLVVLIIGTRAPPIVIRAHQHHQKKFLQWRCSIQSMIESWTAQTWSPETGYKYLIYIIYMYNSQAEGGMLFEISRTRLTSQRNEGLELESFGAYINHGVEMVSSFDSKLKYRYMALVLHCKSGPISGSRDMQRFQKPLV